MDIIDSLPKQLEYCPELSDEKLVTLGTKGLNKLLKNKSVPLKIVKLIKKRRRTLNNRLVAEVHFKT